MIQVYTPSATADAALVASSVAYDRYCDAVEFADKKAAAARWFTPPEGAQAAADAAAAEVERLHAEYKAAFEVTKRERLAADDHSCPTSDDGRQWHVVYSSGERLNVSSEYVVEYSIAMGERWPTDATDGASGRSKHHSHRLADWPGFATALAA